MSLFWRVGPSKWMWWGALIRTGRDSSCAVLKRTHLAGLALNNVLQTPLRVEGLGFQAVYSRQSPLWSQGLICKTKGLDAEVYCPRAV